MHQIYFGALVFKLIIQLVNSLLLSIMLTLLISDRRHVTKQPILDMTSFFIRNMHTNYKKNVSLETAQICFATISVIIHLSNLISLTCQTHCH